jgi:hypothetical protein
MAEKIKQPKQSPIVKFMPIILVGAIVGYAALAYVLLFMPKIGKFLDGGEYDLRPLEARLEDEADYLSEINQALVDYKLVNASHKRKLSLMLPPDEDVPGLYVQLSEIAQNNDFVLLSVDTLLDPESNGAGPNKVHVAANFAGNDYEGFLLLLNDIERLVRVADVKSISFTAGTGNYSVLMDTYYLDEGFSQIRQTEEIPPQPLDDF